MAAESRKPDRRKNVAKDSARTRSESEAGRSGASSLRAIAGFVSDAPGSEFHKLLNDRVRLGILSSLAVREGMSFGELKSLLGVSDGNLSVHARKLEEAGYLNSRKSFSDRVPRTEYRLTPAGRAALERYLKHMEALIQATAGKD